MEPDDTRKMIRPVVAGLMAALSSGGEAPAASGEPAKLPPMLADMPIIKLIGFTRGQFSVEVLDRLVAGANTGR